MPCVLWFSESRVRLEMMMGLFWICGDAVFNPEVGAETGDVFL